ncbi:MAG: FKBP-type peptidyl-prolyl cis-trans isomerase [Pseudomonadales bacterium]|nr:FKBP-type peptidyl-prolyl cis-trans isomerase [Pseudomonadales bacterium]
MSREQVPELIIEDIEVGTGAEVQVGDEILIHYHGTLLDGTVFDSSVDRDTPFQTTIGVGMLIQGWDEGIPGMRVGGKRILTIPSDMAYGAADMGSIPPHSPLKFEVELLEILSSNN